MKLSIEGRSRSRENVYTALFPRVFPLLRHGSLGMLEIQEPRISVTLYKSKTYLLSATQTPTQGRMFETRPRYEPLEIKSRVQSDSYVGVGMADNG